MADEGRGEPYGHATGHDHDHEHEFDLAPPIDAQDPAAEARWRAVLNGDDADAPTLRRLRRIFRPMPSATRCKLCYAPYSAPFGPILKRFGYGPWPKNPSLCGACLNSMEEHQGGAEVDLSFLFADLRGSTALASRMSPGAYGRLLNAFYAIAARAIQAPGGNVDKYLGDGVFALFIPGFAGPDHAARAIGAARQILSDTGADSRLPADARPLPVGIGVHTGVAYVGVLGERNAVTDFTAIGDAVNLTQRLSAAAGARELLISDVAADAAGLDRSGLERRNLDLRGMDRPVTAWAEAAGTAAAA